MAQRGATRRELRLARGAERVPQRILAARSRVVREIWGDRNGAMADHRVLDAAKLDVETLRTPRVARTAPAVRSRRIVAPPASIWINLLAREAASKRLGPAANGAARDLLVYTMIAVNADSEAVLGVAGARIWTRDTAPTSAQQGSALEDEERLRWLEDAQAALGPVAAARILQLVNAHEGDHRSATVAIAAANIPTAAVIATALAGITARQRNPRAEGPLTWLTSIASRLGGWNFCCESRGPRIVARSLDRPRDRIEGFKLPHHLTPGPNSRNSSIPNPGYRMGERRLTTLICSGE